MRYLSFAHAETDFERQRELAATGEDFPPEPKQEHEEGDPCPECSTPIRVSSYSPEHHEPWCPNDDCEWGR
jgi:hypothetical protein